jgi:amidohydrolase
MGSRLLRCLPAEISLDEPPTENQARASAKSRCIHRRVLAVARHRWYTPTMLSRLALLTFAFATTALAQSPDLVTIYKDIHSHPELSHHEERTSGILAEALRAAGYTVTDHIGLYPDGSHAFGVVGILKNGPGPTLLIRADMDALPILEETGLPYASHVTTKNTAGQTIGVMHACGHDVHTTVLIGTASELAASKAKWHGTLMLVGQPSEETIDGAKAMLADHLFQRLGTPDMIIGLHDTSVAPAGKVTIISGPAMASSTAVDITVHGVGGHGAYPQLGKDPIVMAAYLITELQTIVSRQQNPLDPAVITVGSIHGGTKNNIIPDEVKLLLTTRAFSEPSRQINLRAIHQIAEGVATSFGLEPAQAFTVTVHEDEATPPQVNDPALTIRVRAALEQALGKDNVIPQSRAMGSEDVGVFGDPRFTGGKSIPVVYYNLGAMDPVKLAAAEAANKPLPSYHTSKFEPLPQPTLDTGVKAMTATALSLLQ